VAYVQTGSQWLKILDLASQSLVADWVGPPRIWWGGNWSPTGQQFSIGGVHGLNNRTGLWIYDLNERQALKVLSGQITSASWSPDETELAFCIGLPFNEVWVASLDPAISTIDVLGPGRTLEEHYQEMIDHYTRIIKIDPEDTESYLRRAQYSHYLHDKQQVRADMDKYRAILNSQETAVSTDRLMISSVGQKEFSGFHFGTPTNLGPPINSSADDFDMSLSANGLILVFSSNRPSGSGGYDLWMSTRPTVSDPWAEPVNLGPTINTSELDWSPALSADGLELYYSSKRPGGLGREDIYVLTRATTDDNWGEPVNLGSAVNTPINDRTPFISTDGLELYFASLILYSGHGPDDMDILVSTRETKDDPWEKAVNLGPPVNTDYEEYYPKLSSDGLTLFFSSGLFGGVERIRPGFGDSDIWFTTRKTKDSNWGEPVNLGPPVNSVCIEFAPVISADGSTLYFGYDPMDLMPDRGNLGWVDLWQVPISLVPESIQKDVEVDAVRKSIESDDRKEVMPDNRQ
jgi:Tol biopolymer transport system component